MTKVKELVNAFDTHKIDALMVTGLMNIRYLSGFTGSNAVILLTKDEQILITDYRYFEQAKQQTNFKVVLHSGHTGHKEKILEEVANQVNTRNISNLGIEERHLSVGFYERFKELSQVKIVLTYDFVEDVRMIKTPEEIKKIRKACEITDRAYVHITGFIKPGMTELEVAEELVRFIKSKGGTSVGFPPIVASGLRSSLPHGRASDKIIEKGEMITIDFGAGYDGYWADISRTVSIGEPSEKMKEIQGIVLTSFKNCVNNIKPGMMDTEVDHLMREYLIQTGYNEQSGTGSGHGIGLEIHEEPLFSVQKDKVLKEGMVVCVEPGIYLQGIGGARVEDVLLITETGCEVLTPSSKELLVIE